MDALVTAFGLSAAAGLNTTIPLLLAGLCARLGWLELASPYDALQSPWVLMALAVAAAVEFVGDKVPAVDSVIQAVQWPASAAAGAVLFAAQQGAVTWISPELLLVLGLLTGGGVHTARMIARPVVTLFTGGTGNPVLSAGEDAYSLSLAGTAILAPVLALLLLALLLGIIAYAVLRLSRRLRRSPARREPR